MTRRAWRPGFTLIELLTVIAIIAILAGILFPVFAKARAKANQASCLSNLKQLAAAAIMYANDYDQKLPSMWDNAQGDNQLGGWTFYKNFPNGHPDDYDPSRGTLFPYTKNAQIFECPEDDTEQRCSYAINAILGPNPTVQGFHTGIKLTRIARPAGTFLFLEEGSNQGGHTDDGYLLPPGNVASGRHLDGSNVAFCDGHAKWLKPESIRYPNPSGDFHFETR